MSRISIIAAEFNRAIVDPMVAAAHDEAKQLGMTVDRELRVPGSLELPLIAAALLARRDVDAVAVLGYLEKGETLHGEVIGHVVYRALVELQLAHGKPIGVGIIGPGATLQQAETRRDGFARAAIRAAASSLATLAAIDEEPEGKKKKKKKR